MRREIKIVILAALLASYNSIASAQTNAVAPGTNVTYRTWTVNGEHRFLGRFVQFGGEKFPHEVWLESNDAIGGQATRIRVHLDSLSNEDVSFLRSHYPHAYQGDAQREPKPKSQPPVGGDEKSAPHQ